MISRVSFLRAMLFTCGFKKVFLTERSCLGSTNSSSFPSNDENAKARITLERRDKLPSFLQAAPSSRLAVHCSAPTDSCGSKSRPNVKF